MELIRTDGQMAILLKTMNNPMHIRFRTQSNSFGYDFIGRRYTMEPDIGSDELQY
jgi:hypothetical protein